MSNICYSHNCWHEKNQTLADSIYHQSLIKDHFPLQMLVQQVNLHPIFFFHLLALIQLPITTREDKSIIRQHKHKHADLCGLLAFTMFAETLSTLTSHKHQTCLVQTTFPLPCAKLTNALRKANFYEYTFKRGQNSILSPLV